MKHATRTTAAVAAVAFTLAACGTASAGSHATESTSAPATHAHAAAPTTAAPHTWAVAQSQRAYLAMVVGVNVDVRRYDTNAGTTSLPVFTGVCRALADDDAKLARAVTAGLWPVNVKPQAAALVTALAGEEVMYSNCAISTTIADARVATYSGADTTRAIASEQMRIALGLPRPR